MYMADKLLALTITAQPAMKGMKTLVVDRLRPKASIVKPPNTNPTGFHIDGKQPGKIPISEY